MSDYRNELSAATKPAPATPAAEFLVPTNAKLLRQVGTAATWLWVMAGASAINLLLLYVKSPIGIVAGLYLTSLIFAIGHELGAILLGVALIVDALGLGFFILLGFQMKKWRSWAFITGIGLVGIDGVLIYFFTPLAGIWPFLIHALAIYFLFLGLKAAKLLNQRKAVGKA
ncbi:MAG TPA: hypothetical protein VHO24_11055 [Opitutaceae bacterium]|nr:hypothetical protein [Opitutaceae bacterium]